MSVLPEDPFLIQPPRPDDSHGPDAPARESGQLPLVVLNSAPPTQPAILPSEQSSFAPPPPVEIPRDPAWTALDLVRLVVLTIVALIAGIFAVVLIAHAWIYPHAAIGDIARIPLVAIAGQGIAYLLILGYMYVLVTRERLQPRFWKALHWNWPKRVWIYLAAGFVMQAIFLIAERFLPLPKETPFDALLRRPLSVVLVLTFSVTLGPLMEEMFFRGFFYPVVKRRAGILVAIVATAVPFALMHAAQYGNSWASVLLIFVLAVVLAAVREKTDSLAASFLVHVGYNGTIAMLLFVATDGFRHLENLSRQ